MHIYLVDTPNHIKIFDQNILSTIVSLPLDELWLYYSTLSLDRLFIPATDYNGRCRRESRRGHGWRGKSKTFASYIPHYCLSSD